MYIYARFCVGITYMRACNTLGRARAKEETRATTTITRAQQQKQHKAERCVRNEDFAQKERFILDQREEEEKESGAYVCALVSYMCTFKTTLCKKVFLSRVKIRRMRRRHALLFTRNTTHISVNKTSKSQHDRDVPMCFWCGEICEPVFISQTKKKCDDDDD